MKYCALALLLSLPITAVAGEHKPYNRANNAIVPSSKVVKAGEAFQIALPANSTTGYSWVIRTLPPQVALTGMEYVQSADCKKGMVGCKGVTTLYFRAVNAGKGRLILQYARTWEPLPKAIQATEITVTP